MDLVILFLVVGIICFIIWWITTNLVQHALAVKIIWFITFLVLGFYVLRELGVSLPNVIR